HHTHSTCFTTSDYCMQTVEAVSERMVAHSEKAAKRRVPEYHSAIRGSPKAGRVPARARTSAHCVRSKRKLQCKLNLPGIQLRGTDHSVSARSHGAAGLA